MKETIQTIANTFKQKRDKIKQFTVSTYNYFSFVNAFKIVFFTLFSKVYIHESYVQKSEKFFERLFENSGRRGRIYKTILRKFSNILLLLILKTYSMQ